MSSKSKSASKPPRAKELKRSLTFMDKGDTNLKKPVCKGYLYKENVGTFHTAFNRRYFALYKRYLVYYETEHDFEKDVKHGTLEHRHGAIRLDRIYLTKPDTKPRGGKYCFILHAPDKSNKRHEYLLVSKTREERREWMTKLQDQNPKLVPHDAAIAPDTPVPSRKIRSDSFTPNTVSPDLSKLSINRELSNPESDLDEHELELHEGDSDHEYHEPIEEDDEGSVQQNNGHDEVNEEIVIAVPTMINKKKR